MNTDQKNALDELRQHADPGNSWCLSWYGAEIVLNFIAELEAERDYWKAMCDAWGDSARMHRANESQYKSLWKESTDERDSSEKVLRTDTTRYFNLWKKAERERDALRAELAQVKAEQDHQVANSEFWRDALRKVISIVETSPMFSDGEPYQLMSAVQALVDAAQDTKEEPATHAQIVAAVAHGDD